MFDKLWNKLRSGNADTRSVSISLALHVIIIVLFGGTVLFKAIEPPADFSADGGFLGDGSEEASPPGPPSITPPSPEMPAVPVPQTATAMDAMSILSTTSVSAPAFSVPAMTVPSMGKNISADMASAAANMAAAAAKLLPASGGGGAGAWGKSSGKGSWGQGFGSMEKDDLKLVGNLYDFKQSPDGKPLKTSLEDFWREIRGYVESRYNPERLKKYFRSKPIYTAQIFIPFRQASEGPRAFALDAQVKPAMWMIHYRGGFSPASSGKYRFWGRADDSLIAVVDGKVVLDVSRVNGPDGLSRADGNPSQWKNKKSDFKNDVPYPGEWMELKADQTYRLDLLIAEGAPWPQVQRMLNGDKNAGVDGDLLGGDFEALLMIEVGDGKTMGGFYTPQPVFSTLPLEGTLPTSSNPEKNVTVGPPAVFSPKKNVLRGSVRDEL